MNFYWIASLLLVLAAAHDRGDYRVGGYSSLDTNHLDKDTFECDKYLRGRHPELDGAKVISVERQVVAGYNYKFVYEKEVSENKFDTWETVVYRDLKDNLNEMSFQAKRIEAVPDNGVVQETAPSEVPRPELRVGASAPPPEPKVGSSSTPLLTQNTPSTPTVATIAGHARKVYRDVFPNAI